MPIQILRAIFVAIKYYVFGLMAQKYSILGAKVLAPPGIKRNRNKFGGWGGGGETGGLGRGGRVGLWHRQGVYSGHFHDSSDSRAEDATEKDVSGGKRREGHSLSLLRGSPLGRESEL